MAQQTDMSQLIHSRFQQPIVFTHSIEDWPARKWTIQNVASVMKDKKYVCRIGLKQPEGIHWETDCDYEEVSVKEFWEWLSDKTSPENRLKKYDPQKYWAYIDYYYMKEMFSSNPEMLSEVLWDRFGFPGRSGEDSTIWIGSEKASTVGHYDTYGFNLVAQISGRKRWVLFPPEQTDCLYPTRIPFEESSVFSEVLMSNPDLHKHSRLKLSTPYVVDLEPGQVLYVPRHWWHFVECLEPAISVNTWIDLEEDKKEKLKESLTSMIVCSMLPDGDNWLNPNQDFLSMDEGLGQINTVLGLICEKSKQKPGISLCQTAELEKITTLKRKPNPPLLNTPAEKLQKLEEKEEVKQSICLNRSPFRGKDSPQKGTSPRLTDLTKTSEDTLYWPFDGASCQDKASLIEIQPMTFTNYCTFISSRENNSLPAKTPSSDQYSLCHERLDQCDIEDEMIDQSERGGEIVSLKTLVNTLCHPEVMDLVTNLLIKQTLHK